MEDRKRRGWAFWLTATLLAPMLYVGTFGPACWLTSQTPPYWTMARNPPRAMMVYWPLGMLASSHSSSGGSAVRWWMMLGLRKGHSAVVITSVRGDTLVCQ